MRDSSRAATALAVLLLAACAAPVTQPDRTGFISDYSNLKRVDDQTFLYVADELAGYDAFIIDPIVILYDPGEDGSRFSDEELEDVKAHFVEKLTDALTRDEAYAIASEPGPGVARLRYAITALDDTVGALNVALATKITGAGLGGAAIEGEIIDSLTGSQLAATLRWGSGSRVLRAGFTRTGDAKILLARWARELRKRLDELRDSSPTTAGQ